MCSVDTSIISSDSFYSNILHVFTAIEVPLHLFGAYIIIAKTPKRMSSVKQSMLILHTLGALYDFYLSFIAGPVLTIPAIAGYPLGFSLWLGVPTNVLVYLGLSFGVVVCVAVIGFFEDRYHVLCHGQRETRSWKRTAYLIFLYILAFTYISPSFLTIPDKNYAKSEIKQKFPCFPSEIFDRPGFFVLALESTVCVVCCTFMFSFMIIQLIVFSVAIAWKLSTAECRSKKTLQLQKQFMISLGIQVAIPLFVLGLPAGLLVFSVINGSYNQAFTNMNMAVVAAHGIASTVTMLTVHGPYREATIRVLTCCSNKTSSRNSSKIWKIALGAPVSYI